jgi:hypothetical protein
VTARPIRRHVWQSSSHAALAFVTAVAVSWCLVQGLAYGADDFPPPPPALDEQPPTLQSEQDPPTAPAVEPQNAPAALPCTDCGHIRSIRQLRTDRVISQPDLYITSPQYLSTRPAEPPRIGPAFSLSWSEGQRARPHVGPVEGPNLTQRITQISYEIVVEFDDGQFARIEQELLGDLRVGDKVRMVNRRPARVYE